VTTDVILKDVGPQWIAALREKISAHRAIGALFAKTYAALGALRNEGAGIALFHDMEFREQEVDAETGVCLKQAVQVSEPMRCYVLPPATVASIVHHGAFSRIAAAYGALLRWIDASGYRPSGPTREIFLFVSSPVSREDESNITEIQVPVARIDLDRR
jgi:effector-binding domain-containing protein